MPFVRVPDSYWIETRHGVAHGYTQTYSNLIQFNAWRGNGFFARTERIRKQPVCEFCGIYVMTEEPND